VDILSITGNAAAAAQLQHASVGAYMERRYMLSPLNQYSIAGALPTNVGAFGFQLHYFGYAMYQELEPSVSYAKKLGAVDLGIKLNYRVITIPVYGSNASIIPELGTIWHINEKLHTGIRIYNPFSYFAAHTGVERIAYSYSSGIGFEASPIVFLGVSIAKEENQNAEVNTALQYQFANSFFAAFGISSSNTHVRFGFGYRHGSLRMHLLTSWNTRLGISPGLMLIYSPTGKDK
jgi:hypothetical protein